MRILLVEDEERMGKLLVRGLSEEGHVVDWVSLGAQGLERAAATSYDVIVLDWALPDVDGVRVLRTLRSSGVRTAVLMLTARGTIGERVQGLRAGADDYLPKPFDFEELLARLEALGRRSGGVGALRELGSVRVDAQRRTLAGPSGEQTLTAREYQLLSELLDHEGDTLTRAELLAAVWGQTQEVTANVVDVYVGYLRQKLRAAGGEPGIIVAVRGLGYRLQLSRAGAVR